jgi:membrane associated rhomboid family serine protease
MIPIGDSPRSGSVPWVTRAIIVANLIVFLGMLTLSTRLPASNRQALQEFRDQTGGICYGFEANPTDTDRFYCKWSFQPREWFDTVRDQSVTPQQSRWLVVATILTSIFIHAGWLHILGNMLFLWVFGDNVEDRLGHLGFLVFYLLAGVAATLVQGWIDPNSVTPTVGASGAIAGVLGAYLVYFPKARVRTLVPFFPLFLPLDIPAILMIGFWFVQNLFAGLATLGTVGTPDSGVAFFAHVGGFVFGAAVALLFFRRGRQPRGRRPG